MTELIGGRAARRRLAGLGAVPATRTPRAVLARLSGLVDRRLVRLGAVGLAAGVAGLSAGPVAALLAGAYALLAVRSLHRTVNQRRAASARTAALDTIGGLASDLRAGVAPAPAIDAARKVLLAAHRDPAVRRALDRLSAARRVSDRLGAPLADLLDRVESDLRAVERARASVAAQTGGARASAALLALLPVAGVGLGYALGARPDQALLHTPLGAACVLGALLLQSAGLAWTGRLCRAAVERAS